jgi:hypothetical protein
MLTEEKGGMATVTIANVYQSNGNIHVIDAVLLPNEGPTQHVIRGIGQLEKLIRPCGVISRLICYPAWVIPRT